MVTPCQQSNPFSAPIWPKTKMQQSPPMNKQWSLILLVWLYTEHATLNKHLHYIRKVEIPNCPNCTQQNDLASETIHHLLFQCPNYFREHHELCNTLFKRAGNLTFLFTQPHAISEGLASLEGIQSGKDFEETKDHRDLEYQVRTVWLTQWSSTRHNNPQHYCHFSKQEW